MPIQPQEEDLELARRISREARAAGLKVVLSGLGGDETLFGYPSFHDVPNAVRKLRGLAAIPGLGVLLRSSLQHLGGERLSAKYAGAVEYGGTLAGAYLLRRALFMPWEIPSVMDAGMAREGLAELDTLNRLENQHVVNGSTSLFGSARTPTCAPGGAAWTVQVPIYGPEKVVRAQMEYCKEQFAKIPGARFNEGGIRTFLIKNPVRIFVSKNLMMLD